MKFTLAALFASLAATSFAQSIDIGFPANGTSVTPGSTLTVEVDRPNSLTGSAEVAVVIGIMPCGNTACLAPGSALGSILFNGPYNPQFQPTDPAHKPPHQNFTITVPPALVRNAPAQLSVFHVALVEAGPHPLSETKTIVLNVV